MSKFLDLIGGPAHAFKLIRILETLMVQDEPSVRKEVAILV
jgi:hypothetical protein